MCSSSVQHVMIFRDSTSAPRYVSLPLMFAIPSIDDCHAGYYVHLMLMNRDIDVANVGTTWRKMSVTPTIAVRIVWYSFTADVCYAHPILFVVSIMDGRHAGHYCLHSLSCIPYYFVVQPIHFDVQDWITPRRSGGSAPR